MDALLRLGSLLALGFGEAGRHMYSNSTVITENPINRYSVKLENEIEV